METLNLASRDQLLKPYGLELKKVPSEKYYNLVYKGNVIKQFATLSLKRRSTHYLLTSAYMANPQLLSHDRNYISAMSATLGAE